MNFLLNPKKSSSALLETCPYLQNALCIFVDLSYSIQHLWPGLLAPFEEVKVPVSNSAEFVPKKCPLEDFEWFGLNTTNFSADIVYTLVLCENVIKLFHFLYIMVVRNSLHS